MKYTAVVVGATGLVGRYLVQELINDESCTEIRIIVRRKTEFKHPKLVECIIDFEKEEEYLQNIKGDVLFSCLGTTRTQAGSPANQYKVDYGYQYRAAKSAFANGVQHYVLVSSPFADIHSSNYYRKMKAELEQDTLNLGFTKTIILRPNGLAGNRKGNRKWESIATAIFTPIMGLFPALRKYQPIHGKLVAQAMLKSFYTLSHSDSDIHLAYDRFEINRFLEG